MRRSIAFLVMVALAAACGGGDDGVQVSDARVSEPAGPNAAMYFTATSDEGDRLIGASTPWASSVQIHETTMNSDGTMGMNSVEVLEIPAGGELVLEPGGHHLMLIDAQPFTEGSEIEVTLVWEAAGEETYSVEVVAPGDTVDDES